MKLGGSIESVTSIRQCQASLKGLSAEEVQMCLEVEASASIKDKKISTEAKHCKKDIQQTDSKSAFSSLFNDRYVKVFSDISDLLSLLTPARCQTCSSIN